MSSNTDHTIAELVAVGREGDARVRFGDIRVDEWFRDNDENPHAVRGTQYRIYKLNGPTREQVGDDHYYRDAVVLAAGITGQRHARVEDAMLDLATSSRCRLPRANMPDSADVEIEVLDWTPPRPPVLA